MYKQRLMLVHCRTDARRVECLDRMNYNIQHLRRIFSRNQYPDYELYSCFTQQTDTLIIHSQSVKAFRYNYKKSWQACDKYKRKWLVRASRVICRNNSIEEFL